MTLSRLARWLRRGNAAILAVAIVSIAVCYTLLATTKGSRWLFEMGTQRIPAEVTWQTFSGNMIQGIRLSGLTFSQKDMHFSAAEISAKWNVLSVLGGQFFIEAIKVDNPTIIIPENPGSGPSKPWPYLGILFPVQLQEAHIHHLKLDIASKRHDVEKIALSASINPLGMSIRNLSVNNGQQQLVLKGKIGPKAPYHLNLELNWQTRDSANTLLGGVAKLGGNLKAIRLSHDLTTPIAISTKGTLDTKFNPSRASLRPELIEAKLSHQWQFDNLRLTPLKQLLSSTGKLFTEGSYSKYRVWGKLHLTTPETSKLLPLTHQITLEAFGTPLQIHFERLLINSSAGELEGVGRVSWVDLPAWDFSFQGRNINSGIYWPDWPSSLNIGTQIFGEIGTNGINWRADVANINGHLRSFPLTASGHAEYTNGSYGTSDLRIAVGSNQLLLDAKMDKDIKAKWTLKARDLAQIYPSLKGSLHSTGDLRGQRLDASLHARELAYENYTLETLDAQITNINSAESKYDLEVTGTELHLDNIVVNRLGLDAMGQINQHNYQLKARQQGVNIQLGGSGRWKNQEWHTDIATANLHSENLGNWLLEKNANANLRWKQLQLDSSCWLSDEDKICVEANYDEMSGLNLSSQIHSLTLTLLKPWLPENMQAHGSLTGTVALSNSLRELKGKLQAAVNSGKFIVTNIQQKPSHIAFQDIQIDGEISDGFLQLKGTGKTHDSGRAEMQLSYPLTQATAPVRGHLKATLYELNWLDPFVFFLDDLTGNADVGLVLSGTREKPELTGNIRLSELGAFVPQLGITLRNGNLHMQQQTINQWIMSGGLDSGKGSLRINGNATLSSFDDWRAQLLADGENLQTLDLEKISASISPQLRVNIQPQQLEVTGNVQIPSAKIIIKERPAETVLISKDEIIVDPQNTSSSIKPAFATISDINLSFGDDVRLDAFGVNGSVRGNLRLRENRAQPLRVEGTVEINKGTYEAYGQSLTINPGRLIFSGPPEYPLVNIRASREVDAQRVGVQISGTPTALVSELFSVPSLPQPEALALLLTGKPLTSANQDDSSRLLSAISSLGIRHSAGLTQRLQQSVGLDMLTLSSEAGIEHSALTIGKYITPKLFISYVQELLSPNASANLEYSISKKLKIKAQSGTEQSMGIFYQFEN